MKRNPIVNAAAVEWGALPEFIQRRFQCDDELAYNSGKRCQLPPGHPGWHRWENSVKFSEWMKV